MPDFNLSGSGYGGSSNWGIPDWGHSTPPYNPVPSIMPSAGFDAPMTTLPNGASMMSQIPGQLTKTTAGLTPKLGLNFDTAQLALSGLSTIGNLWAAFQAQKLAKEQFKFTKNFSTANFNNQVQTYNSAVTDRANNRAIVEGRDAGYTQHYIDTNRLNSFGK